jgi:hypothetical protein
MERRKASASRRTRSRARRRGKESERLSALHPPRFRRGEFAGLRRTPPRECIVMPGPRIAGSSPAMTENGTIETSPLPLAARHAQ